MSKKELPLKKILKINDIVVFKVLVRLEMTMKRQLDLAAPTQKLLNHNKQ